MSAASQFKILGVILVLLIVAAAALSFFRHTEAPAMTTQPKTVSENCEFATLGGGCFWCLESVFDQLNGVERVESGYCNGTTKNPTYRDVCTGTTGHAEVVQIAFDPKVISYRDLLLVFFVTHDPTTLNYQGPDHGTQYRSGIFYHSPQQKETAEAVIAELTRDKAFSRPIVTQVAPLDTFYRAEQYHQNFYASNPGHGYCQRMIPPKLEKLRKHFKAMLKTS
jgi:peptide-methionine (S)-S-oxide reductase